MGMSLEARTGQHASKMNGNCWVPGSEHAPGSSGSVCWTALMEDAGNPVIVLDSSGRISMSNHRGAGLLGAAPGGLGGRNYADFYSAEFARERLGFVRSVAETGQAVMVDGMVNGVWHRASMRRMTLMQDGTPLVLMVLTPGAPVEPSAGTTVVRGKVDDFGALAALTNREIEILRLIGEGLSTAEIAKQLHRSVKTIEWHRVSLGSKLKATNRVGLARIAIQAGLSRLGNGAAAPSSDAA